MFDKRNTICLFKIGCGAVFVAILFLFIHISLTHSATAEELQNQIQAITNTKAELEKEISAYEQQLKDLGTQTTSLGNEIKALNATINKNALNIKLTQNKIDSTTLQIQELSLNIGKNIVTIDEDTKAIMLLINKVNEYDSASIIENLMTYNNLSEIWNEEQNISTVQNQIKQKIDEAKNTKTILEDNKKQAESKKAELLKLKSSLVDQKKVLDITKKEKNKLLTDTKNSESNYKKMIADKKALSDAFDKELIQFESALNFNISPDSFPSANNAVLSWPFDYIRITQKFGVTDFSKKTNIYGGKGHNGVDFWAAIGTPIKAVLSGTIEGTGDTDPVCPGASNGKWILIRHDNGLSSIYAHLSLIKAVTGQRVSTGDVIGLSGYSGFVYPPGPQGAHLHLGLFISQGVKIMSRKSVVCNATYTMPVADLRAYLDPLAYLPSH